MERDTMKHRDIGLTVISDLTGTFNLPLKVQPWLDCVMGQEEMNGSKEFFILATTQAGKYYNVWNQKKKKELMEKDTS